jgi:hypothetical protein
MSFWSIKYNDGLFQIVGQQKHANGMWKDDPEHRYTFPSAATADDVIARMIAILQDAARQ